MTPAPEQKANAPAGWCRGAHAHWQSGRRNTAIATVLDEINTHGVRKPVGLMVQLSCYVFLTGDAAGAAKILSAARSQYPDHQDVLKNLSVYLYRSGQYDAAATLIEQHLPAWRNDFAAYDGLAACYWRLGRLRDAKRAGSRSLAMKDQVGSEPPVNWNLPAGTPDAWAPLQGRENVIAFSLWGRNPRYLRGAVDNVLASARHYPGWRCRFYVDDTVPGDVLGLLKNLGADVRLELPNQAERNKLAWRFKVSNDPAVGRFLVRDADSLVGKREQLAVSAWLQSGRWFHVMRDWWTHTDPIFAGMWGGVSGVLPPLDSLLETYQSPAIDTPNVDQWFLRDKVWPYVRRSCLVHDRCFDSAGALRWPGPPPAGDRHVGENEYAARGAEQQERLRSRFSGVASLQIEPST